MRARKGTPFEVAVFGEFEPTQLADAASKGFEATARAEAYLERIREIVGRTDQIDLLARLAFLCIADSSAGPSPRREPLIQVHELELVQAVALADGRVVRRDTGGMPQVVEDLLRLVSQHTRAVGDMSFTHLGGDAQRNRVEAVLDRMRGTTHSVRGPRHAFQTRAYCRDLAAALDEDFHNALGFTVTDVMEFLEGFADRSSRRLEALRASAAKWMRVSDPQRMLRSFLVENPHFGDDDVIVGLRSARIPETQTRVALQALFEEQLKDIFVVTSPDDDARRSRLHDGVGRLSLRFREVDDAVLPHLKLSNPVRTKPFVHDDDGRLHLFCTQTTFAAMAELIDEMTAETPALRQRCEKFKGRWLEGRLQELVASAFPSGRTLGNAKWKDADGRPGETDCILLVDKTVGLFEAKSGRISPPAKRGAEDRLRRNIHRLLVEPSRQSARLARRLGAGGGIELDTPGGTVTIPPSDIREIARVNVVFDTLGPLTACTRRLVEAGFIGADEPMAPTMSIFELETVFDLLPDQVSRLHYLRRRQAIERDLLIEADEMDLIALYLESSFCISDMTPGDHGFSIYGWSDVVAWLYDHEGRRGDRPSVKRTPFFKAVIETIDNEAGPGWTRFGHRLASVPYRDQWAVSRRRDEVARKARRLPSGRSAFSGLFAHEVAGGTVLGLCVGKDLAPYGIEEHCREAAVDLARSVGAVEAMVLYWDVKDEPGEPRFVASFKRPD